MIRQATIADAGAIAETYNHYVLHTIVSFEEQAIGASEIAYRIDEAKRTFAWLVLEEHGRIVGYAYTKPWNPRSAYRFSVETTVYVAPRRIGRGYGRQLYKTLLDRLRNRSMHSAIGFHRPAQPRQHRAA